MTTTKKTDKTVYETPEQLVDAMFAWCRAEIGKIRTPLHGAAVLRVAEGGGGGDEGCVNVLDDVKDMPGWLCLDAFLNDYHDSFDGNYSVSIDWWFECEPLYGKDGFIGEETGEFYESQEDGNYARQLCVCRLPTSRIAELPDSDTLESRGADESNEDRSELINRLAVSVLPVLTDGPDLGLKELEKTVCSNLGDYFGPGLDSPMFRLYWHRTDSGNEAACTLCAIDVDYEAINDRHSCTREVLLAYVTRHWEYLQRVLEAK